MKKNPSKDAVIGAIIILGLYILVVTVWDHMAAKPVDRGPLYLCPFCYQPYPIK